MRAICFKKCRQRGASYYISKFWVRPPMYGALRSAPEHFHVIKPLQSTPGVLHIGGVPTQDLLMYRGSSISSTLFSTPVLVIHPRRSWLICIRGGIIVRPLWWDVCPQTEMRCVQGHIVTLHCTLYYDTRNINSVSYDKASRNSLNPWMMQGPSQGLGRDIQCII